MSTSFVHLIGAEDVARASSRIAEAAESFRQTVASLEDSLFRQRQFMDDWLARFEQIMSKREVPR